jgi:flagellar biosynthesis/type III secretory pathway protein FliH
MSRGTESRPAYKLRCQNRIIEARMSRDRRILLLDFVEAYLQLTPSEAAEYKIFSVRNRRRTRAMLMTWSERLKAEGKREGLELGKQKGLALGKQKGLKLGEQKGLRLGKQEGARSLQQVLLRLLDQRFGPLAESVHRQVEAINSLPRLTRLAEQVLTAGSIRELRLR